MKQYNSQILKINSYPLKVCKYPLIGIVLDGNCTLKKFNRIFSFNTQDVFFVNPDEVYAIKGECIIGFIEIYSENLKYIELIDALDSMDLKKDISNTYRDCIFIKNLLTLFRNEEHLNEVLSSLTQDYSLMNNYHHHLLPLNNKQKNIYLQIVETVQNNYQSHLSLSDIATRLTIQKNRLSNIFKDITNMTVLDYINHIRLIKAEKALLIDNLNNEEIIEKYGFSDRKYFYRYFQEYFNDTPLNYKEKTETYLLKDYKQIVSEGSFYLDKMKKELDSLNINTYFYEKYIFLKKLDELNSLNGMTIQLDLFNKANYLVVDDDITNSWYGFDLINTFVLKYQLSVELDFIIDEETDYRKINEVLNLLDRSAQSLDLRIIKYWKFIITLNNSSSFHYADYILSRLKSLFKTNSITIKNTL